MWLGSTGMDMGTDTNGDTTSENIPDTGDNIFYTFITCNLQI